MGRVADAPGFRVQEFLVGGELPWPPINEHAVLGLSHFDLSANELVGNGVAVAMYANGALAVNDALMEAIDLRHPFGERLERRFVDSKELFGCGMDMFSEHRVFLIAPGTSSGVELVPVGKGSSREEVVLDEVERPLHSGWRRPFRGP